MKSKSSVLLSTALRTKKRLVLVIVFMLLFNLMANSELHAQREEGVFVELGGASTTVGIHYDTRFNKKTHWGARIGIAYTRSKSPAFFDNLADLTTGWTFPIAVNCLIGKRKNRFEIGMGVSYGLYTCVFYDKFGHQTKDNKSGSFAFLDLGYRYQPKKGLVVRLGLNPGMALYEGKVGKKNEAVFRAAVIYPYFSLGYNF